MQHGLDGLLCKHRIKQLRIAHVAGVQTHALRHRCPMAGKKIVEHHRCFAALQQGTHVVRTNIPSTTANQNSHICSAPSFAANLRMAILHVSKYFGKRIEKARLWPPCSVACGPLRAFDGCGKPAPRYSCLSTSSANEATASGSLEASPSILRPSAMMTAPSSLARSSMTGTAPQKCSYS